MYCRVRSLQLVGAVVQLGLEGPEVRPLFWLGAPTLQHDLVQEFGAFGRSRHPVTFDDLLVRLLVVQGWGRVMGVEGEERGRSD